MTKNKKSQTNKSRTYARNRTNLSRRGLDKQPENDSVFLFKLISCVILASFWLKFASPIELFGAALGGLPIGIIIGLFLVHFFEKKQTNRKIFFTAMVIIMVLTYFVPAGIVI